MFWKILPKKIYYTYYFGLDFETFFYVSLIPLVVLCKQFVLLRGQSTAEIFGLKAASGGGNNTQRPVGASVLSANITVFQMLKWDLKLDSRY